MQALRKSPGSPPANERGTSNSAHNHEADGILARLKRDDPETALSALDALSAVAGAAIDDQRTVPATEGHGGHVGSCEVGRGMAWSLPAGTPLTVLGDPLGDRPSAALTLGPATLTVGRTVGPVLLAAA